MKRKMVNYHKDLNMGDKIFGTGILRMNRDKIYKRKAK